jgi:hypothetical protein
VFESASCAQPTPMPSRELLFESVNKARSDIQLVSCDQLL